MIYTFEDLKLYNELYKYINNLYLPSYIFFKN